MGTRIQGYKSLQKKAGKHLLSNLEEYSNIRSILTFLCKDCKEQFKTTAWLYQRSEDGKRCTKCKKKLTVSSLSAKTTFISRCLSLHGQYYDYSKLPDSFSAKDKITITCPKHGDFKQTPDVHLRGSGCSKCKIDKVTSATRSNKTDFIVKANKVHNFKYNYTKSVYQNAKTSLTITCPKHGDFEQTPDVHLRGSGCVLCNLSAPAQHIIDVLNELKIPYTTEKSFKGCSGVNKSLRFDFYIPDRNLCIEYDGLHHFEPVKFNSSQKEAQKRFNIQRRNDEIKNKFCEENNINLIRIPYTIHHPGAFIRKFLTKEEPATRFFYTYEMLETDIRKISNYIKSFNYERFAVYGISRGGIPFAVSLSYHFDQISEFGIATFQRYDGNSKTVKLDIKHKTKDIPIFVVDDLISSGITMNRVIKKLKHSYKNAVIHPIVIFGEENDDDIFFIREHPKQWVVFPYEI